MHELHKIFFHIEHFNGDEKLTYIVFPKKRFRQTRVVQELTPLQLLLLRFGSRKPQQPPARISATRRRKLNKKINQSIT